MLSLWKLSQLVTVLVQLQKEIGKDWLKISHIPKGDIKELSQDDSEEQSQDMPALQRCYPQYILGL